MSKQITFLEQLPDDFGKRGKAFTPYHDYAKNTAKFIHRHASEAGLILGIISFTMVMI